MPVFVANRQRRVRVNTAEIQLMADCLFEAVCKNLVTYPAARLPRRSVERMRQRACLSLVLLSNRGIRKVNKAWRAKDTETDVLSFPLNLSEPKQDMPWELGEVIISLEKAFEQAFLLHHSPKRELAFLFVHGMLHILGFDHEQAADEKIMIERQNSILKFAGYARD
jgi:probable rRNA maturation factor